MILWSCSWFLLKNIDSSSFNTFFQVLFHSNFATISPNRSIPLQPSSAKGPWLFLSFKFTYKYLINTSAKMSKKREAKQIISPFSRPDSPRTSLLLQVRSSVRNTTEKYGRCTKFGQLKEKFKTLLLQTNAISSTPRWFDVSTKSDSLSLSTSTDGCQTNGVPP